MTNIILIIIVIVISILTIIITIIVFFSYLSLYYPGLHEVSPSQAEVDLTHRVLCKPWRMGSRA